jgi:translocation and assembly module TamB
LLFKDHVFQIQSASMRFDNPAVLNPLYSLTATTEISGRRVQLYSSGNIDRPKIELTANPAMTESEILSLLAIGVSDDGRRIRSDRSNVEQGEAASLLLHSLDFNRDVQDRTGFEIQLDEAAEAGAAISAFKPRTAETESTAAPKIVIKRKVGKRVQLSVGSTVGVGTSSQREVNAEYRFTPAFSVLGVWDTLESVDKSQARNTSYGLDFKLQKRFK